MSTLDDIVEYLDGAQQYENYIAALCPFHDDSRASFMVYEDGYMCLACDAKGSTKYLLKKLSGKPIQPKKKSRFSNPWRRWLRKQSLGQLLKSNWQILKDNSAMGSYLTNRSIPPEIQRNLGIGYRENWFTIPIRKENGRIGGAVARAGKGNKSSSKYLVPSGQDPNLLYVPDWKLLEKHRYILLTFGILDAVSLYTIGLPAMSTLSGKRLDPAVLDNFRTRIYIIPDEGEEHAGQLLASALGWRGVLPKINYPEGCKDPNDVLVNHRELLVEMVENFNG